MKLRDGGAADVAAIAALFTDSIHQLAAAHYDPLQRDAWAPRPPDLAEWRERLAGLQTLLAERDAQLIGFLSYRNDGYLALLFTSPGHARRGVAATLYAEVEARLRGLGVRELFTEASLVAQPFFARQRFVVVEQQCVERRGVQFRRHLMRKHIDTSVRRR